jgi:hypothetical protein
MSIVSRVESIIRLPRALARGTEYDNPPWVLTLILGRDKILGLIILCRVKTRFNRGHCAHELKLVAKW